MARITIGLDLDSGLFERRGARATETADRLTRSLNNANAPMVRLSSSANRTGATFASYARQADLAAVSTQRLLGSLNLASLAGWAGGLLGANAVLGGMVQGVREAQTAFAQLEAGIRSTGGVVGFTAKELAGFATTLQRSTAISDEAIQGAQSVLLTFSNVIGENFKGATAAVLDLSARMGTDLNSAALLVGKALNAPATALSSLTRAGIQFTESQKAMISQMVAVGDIAKAQRQILAELERQFGGSAAAFRNTLPGALEAVKNGFGDILEGLGFEGAGPATALLNGIARSLEAVADNIDPLIASLSGLATAFAALKLAGIVTAVGSSAVAFNGLMAVIAAVVAPVQALTVGVASLNAAMAANPAGAMAIALGLTATATVAWKRANDEAKVAAEELNAAIDRTNERLQKQARHFGNAAEAALKSALADREKLKAGLAETYQTVRTFVPPELISGANRDKVPANSGMARRLKELDDLQGRIQQNEQEIRRLEQQVKRTAEEDALWKDIGANLADVLGKRDKATQGAAKATEQLGSAIAGSRKNLETEFEQLTRLLGAVRQSPAAYDAMKAAIEAEKQATQGGIPLDRARAEGLTALAQRVVTLRQELETLTGKLDQARLLDKIPKELPAVRLDPFKIVADPARLGLFNSIEQFMRRGVELSRDLRSEEEKRGQAAAELLAHYRSGHISLDQLNRGMRQFADTWEVVDLRAEAFQARLEALTAPIVAAFDDIGRQLGAAIGQGVQTGELRFKDLAKSVTTTMSQAFGDMMGEFLSRWTRALGQWLADWIKKLAVAKAAERAANLGGNTGKVGSIGVDANILDNAARGAGGGLFTGGAGGYGSVGAFATSFGWILPAAAGLYAIYKGFIEESTRWAEANLSTGATGGNSGKVLKTVLGHFAELRKSITAFAEQLGLEVEKLGDVTIGKRGKSYYVRSLMDGVNQAFRSFEEAMAFATARAIQLAELSTKNSELVRAAVRGSVVAGARTPDQVADITNWARELENRGKPQILQEMSSFIERFFSDVERAFSVFRNNVPQFLNAMTLAGGSFVQSFIGLINQVTGRKEDPRKEAERIASLIKAQHTLAVVQIQTLMAEIKARIASIQAIGAHGGAILNNGQIFVGMAEVLAKTGAILSRQATDSLALLQAQLDALGVVLADLLAIKLPDADEILRGGQRAGRGGGGGSGQNLADVIRDSVWNTTLAGMTDFGRGLAEINRKWEEATKGRELEANALDKAKRRRDEAIKAANGNAEAIKKANEQYEREVRRIGRTKEQLDAANRARQAEIELLQQQARQRAEELAGIGTDFTRALGDGMAVFRDLEAQGRAKTGMPDWYREFLEGRFLERMGQNFQQMLNEFNGFTDPFLQIGIQADILKQNLAALAKEAGWDSERVADANAQIDAGVAFQKEQATLNVLGQLFRYAEKLPQYAGKVAEFKKKEVDLQFRLLEFQLKAVGAWDEETQKIFGDVRKFAEDFANETERAFDKWAVFWQRQEELQQQFADAAKSARDRFLEIVKSLVESNRRLLTGSNSSLTPQQQFATAFADYQRTLGLARGGNSEALGSIAGIRDTLLQVAQRYFAGGAGDGLLAGYDQLLRQTVEDLAALALSPQIETAAIQDLMNRQLATLQTVGNTLHIDLQNLRQTMIDLLGQYKVGNVGGGPAAFGALSGPGVAGGASQVLGPPSPPAFQESYYRPMVEPPSLRRTASNDSGELIRRLDEQDQELALLHKYMAQIATNTGRTAIAVEGAVSEFEGLGEAARTHSAAIKRGMAR